jgi:hypothetical protein
MRLGSVHEEDNCQRTKQKQKAPTKKLTDEPFARVPSRRLPCVCEEGVRRPTQTRQTRRRARNAHELNEGRVVALQKRLLAPEGVPGNKNKNKNSQNHQNNKNKSNNDDNDDHDDDDEDSDNEYQNPPIAPTKQLRAVLVKLHTTT